MPVGTQFFDANGKLTLDFTDKVGRVLGSIETGTIPGSITDARFLTGRPFFIFRGYNVPGARGLPAPVISIAGTTLSWTAGNSADVGVPNVNGLIVYGVY